MVSWLPFNRPNASSPTLCQLEAGSSPVDLAQPVPGRLRPIRDEVDCEPLELGPPAFPVPSAMEAAERPQGSNEQVLRPTLWLTARQIFYLVVIQGFGALLIAGGLNFAIGYFLYSSPRPPPGPPPAGSPPPFLFRPPVSLLIDAAFTTIIETALTWFSAFFIVTRDLTRGRIAPFDLSVWLPVIRRGNRACAASRPFWRWFFFLDHYTAERGSVLCACFGGRRSGFGRGAAFVLAGLGRSLLVAALAFALMVGPTVGVLAAVGRPFAGDFVFLGRWDGAVFKAVFGGVLGLLVSPTLALMWMARAAWIVRNWGA
ncbi:uncharacterized protein THITE_115797 [Thermothielavioides terrestris NRRL 8126]|uniref:Uncharacterized protein n=1 Tax=Thermothielavioides terrestris (strain ATCC 38088 / NRRL 8126) TaxID=578455 RepID=G2QRC7_THETT|nr:uncharacterized protein THITE_115797 [Thermothielavioides terrestris NRRL 8126]AEO64179.1 hypothetical protein THITE_115797 [Thermothielavioides terrestris NRRL 8126]